MRREGTSALSGQLDADAGHPSQPVEMKGSGEGPRMSAGCAYGFRTGLDR
jgi:hypothetical protein